MRTTKIALAAAVLLGSITAASAQNSPAAASGQGAASSPGSANPSATMNDPKAKQGSGAMMKQDAHPMTKEGAGSTHDMKDHMKK